MKTSETIVIAKDFSDTPGARYRADGPYSGQQFYEEILVPKFKKAVEKNEILVVDLDGTWGYPSSFISGAFGLLSINYTAENVLQHIQFKSEENELLVEKFQNEIKSPTTKPK